MWGEQEGCGESRRVVGASRRVERTSRRVEGYSLPRILEAELAAQTLTRGGIPHQLRALGHAAEDTDHQYVTRYCQHTRG